MAECVIHWFRRDLRLRDNLALEAALRTGVPVIPVFILDERILAQPTMGERRLQFLRTALEELITKAEALDMDEVRASMAQSSAETSSAQTPAQA